MSEALDCPFCGSPAEEFGHDNHGLMYTSHGCSNKECPARRLRCPLGFWNTRHAAPVVISEGAPWVKCSDLPERAEDPYYGRRYSIPVLLHPSVASAMFRWDYRMNGWVEATWRDGCNPDDYSDWDISPTHWLPLPFPPKG